MSVHYSDNLITLHHGHALDVAKTLPSECVQTIVTSPPYFGLRDYGEDGQIGAEESVDEYVAALVALFAELRRVLADDGTLWLNLGDSYAGTGGSGPTSGKSTLLGNGHMGGGPKAKVVRTSGKRAQAGVHSKNLLGVPWRVAFALQEDGWILRSDIVWAKPSGMPESVTDRPTRSHEFVFLFAKSPRYFYDHEAIAETSTGRASGNDFVRPKQISRGGVGSTTGWEGRPQLRRALEIAKAKGLTEEHFAAIRVVGMNDAGKAQAVQSGAGKNAPRVQKLADEAKAALGGYYREFLSGGTRNKRDVWTVATVPFGEAHFAVYPPELIRPCILAGSRRGDTVLDPFSGSGTTGMVATQEGRRYIGIDLSAEYLDLSLRTRFQQPVLDMTGGAA